MIEVDLYDTEFSYGFEFRFKDEIQLNEFLELNLRFKVMSIRKDIPPS